MEIVTIRLREYFSDATTVEKAIISFITQNAKDVTKMSIHKLSLETFTSPSSIIRLCKKMGFDGYKGFIKALVYEIAVKENYKTKEISDISKADNTEEIIHKVTSRNIIALEETSDLLSAEAVDECVKRIEQCDKLAFFGIGASLIVAKDAQLKFTRINKMAYVSEDWHTQLLLAKNMNKNDLAIVISYSGQTEEMSICQKAAIEAGASTISITKYADSPIAKSAELNLYISSNEYAFRSGAMSSRISQLNLIDIIYTSYVNRKFEQTIEILEKTQFRKVRNKDD